MSKLFVESEGPADASKVISLVTGGHNPRVMCAVGLEADPSQIVTTNANNDLPLIAVDRFTNGSEDDFKLHLMGILLNKFGVEIEPANIDMPCKVSTPARVYHNGRPPAAYIPLLGLAADFNPKRVRGTKPRLAELKAVRQGLSQLRGSVPRVWRVERELLHMYDDKIRS